MIQKSGSTFKVNWQVFNKGKFYQSDRCTSRPIQGWMIIFDQIHAYAEQKITKVISFYILALLKLKFLRENVLNFHFQGFSPFHTIAQIFILHKKLDLGQVITSATSRDVFFNSCSETNHLCVFHWFYTWFYTLLNVL